MTSKIFFARTIQSFLHVPPHERNRVVHNHLKTYACKGQRVPNMKRPDVLKKDPGAVPPPAEETTAPPATEEGADQGEGGEGGGEDNDD